MEAEGQVAEWLVVSRHSASVENENEWVSGWMTERKKKRTLPSRPGAVWEQLGSNKTFRMGRRLTRLEEHGFFVVPGTGFCSFLNEKVFTPSENIYYLLCTWHGSRHWGYSEQSIQSLSWSLHLVEGNRQHLYFWSAGCKSDVAATPSPTLINLLEQLTNLK